MLEEFDHVRLSGEHLFFERHGDNIAARELGGVGTVYVFFSEVFGPAGGKGASCLVGVRGGSAVFLDYSKINCFGIEGRPQFQESFSWADLPPLGGEAPWSFSAICFSI